MKKQPFILLLSWLSISLLVGCSKSNTTPTPASPIVGQFDLSRAELTDFPSSFSANNRLVTSTTALGTDSYLFTNDNTYTNTYSMSTTATATETGSYAYVSTTQTVTLTPVAPSGQAPQPYALLYNSTANELSTGKITHQTSLTSPVTG